MCDGRINSRDRKKWYKGDGAIDRVEIGSSSEKKGLALTRLALQTEYKIEESRELILRSG